MQEKVDLKCLFWWIIRKWIYIIGGTILIAIALVGFQYRRAEQKYIASQNEYSIEQLENELTEEEINMVNAEIILNSYILADNDTLYQQIRENVTEGSMEQALEFYAKMRNQFEFRNYVRGELNEKQIIYLNLVTGEVDMSAPQPQITKKMVVFCLLLGGVVAVILCVAWYMFYGYLHSGREIELNFKTPYYVIRDSKKKWEKAVSIMSDSFRKESATTDLLIRVEGKKLVDASLVKLIGEGLKATVCQYDAKDVDLQEKIKEVQNVVLLTKTNSTRLEQLAEVIDLLGTLGVNIQGIVVVE